MVESGLWRSSWKRLLYKKSWVRISQCPIIINYKVILIFIYLGLFFFLIIYVLRTFAPPLALPTLLWIPPPSAWEALPPKDPSTFGPLKGRRRPLLIPWLTFPLPRLWLFVLLPHSVLRTPAFGCLSEAFGYADTVRRKGGGQGQGGKGEGISNRILNGQRLTTKINIKLLEIK